MCTELVMAIIVEALACPSIGFGKARGKGFTQTGRPILFTMRLNSIIFSFPV